MAPRLPPYCFPLLITHLLLLTIFSGVDDGEALKLIKFKSSLSNTDALTHWDPNNPPCDPTRPTNWTGVMCDKNGSQVFGLQLENMGLSGSIDMDTLAELSGLRTLSFTNNSFNGSMPNVQKIDLLRNIYLSDNGFSGEIRGDAFSGMSSIRRVELGNNGFSGEIPGSLLELEILVDLQLQNNKFEGEIPDFKQEGLRVNFANNRLDGAIPAGLRNQDPNSFTGNNVCGEPLRACKKNQKTRKTIIFVIAAIVALLAATFIALFVLRSRRKPKNGHKNHLTKVHKEMEIYKHQEKYKRSENGGKIEFLRRDREIFELQDLLRASAEVLGSGSFGSSYKATLLQGQEVVVKRYMEMSNVGKQEFYAHITKLGSLSHPNLLPLVAFYYKKDEKLFITDFAPNGSLASHLHGKRKPNEQGLNWSRRLKIIKGVAQGLDYLHKELPRFSLPHGHLKSSNVLLDESFNPLLADYALIPIVDKQHAQQFMAAYKSPEFSQHDRITKKTDSWCLGILILEMLTGKFPASYLKQGKGGNSDLETWVNSVVREEWTGEVFDKEMKRTKSGEGEMLKMLKIGMCCCEWSVERRLELRVAFEKIEELKERGNDEDFSSYASEADGYNSSSRVVTDDDFSFSVTG